MRSFILLALLANHAAANNATMPQLCGNQLLSSFAHSCREVLVPESQGWSGGYCLASVAEAGWLRSAILNPVMSLVLATDVTEGVLPIAVGSNSGGSMFAIRYFTLRHYPIATKWSYPCYLMVDPYKNVCYFHSNFGAISNECFSEAFNVISISVALVYGQVAKTYGGPFGVAATYLAAYFPFISNLPLSAGDMKWNAFVTKYVIWPTFFWHTFQLACGSHSGFPQASRNQPIQLWI